MIYGISSDDIPNYPIKIGYCFEDDDWSASADCNRVDRLEKRLKQLQTASPYKLKVLFYFWEGGLKTAREDEAEIKRKFWKQNIRGEWFRRSDQLMEYLSERQKDYDNKDFLKEIRWVNR